MKFILGLVLWCAVNIVTSEEQDAVMIDKEHLGNGFENLGTDDGISLPPSSFVIEGSIFINILKFYNCSIQMA